MDNLTKNKIQKLIESNPLMVFMKGTKLMPQCGFSNNVVQILNSLGVEFSTFDVLSDFEVREGIKEYLSLIHIRRCRRIERCRSRWSPYH